MRARGSRKEGRATTGVDARDVFTPRSGANPEQAVERARVGALLDGPAQEDHPPPSSVRFRAAKRKNVCLDPAQHPSTFEKVCPMEFMSGGLTSS